MSPDLDDIRSALARIPNPIAVLENLFARAPVGLQIYEASGRSLLVNAAFVELFGVEPPPGYNVLHDEIAQKNGVLALIHRAFAGETITVPPVWYDPRELTQVRLEKGNRVAIQATFVPLFDSRGGQVTHVAIVFRDLTAELLQRAQLEEERGLLAAIVDQLLAVQRKACDLSLVARAAVDAATESSAGREVRLETSGDARGHFDAERVAQLLSNLLQDAIAKGAEQIAVEVRGLEFHVELAVRSCGPCIPPEEQAALFDPFRRGAKGLGLFIAQQIAQAHGGGVSVASDAQGTVFRATLQR